MQLAVIWQYLPTLITMTEEGRPPLAKSGHLVSQTGQLGGSRKASAQRLVGIQRLPKSSR